MAMRLKEFRAGEIAIGQVTPSGGDVVNRLVLTGGAPA
jgi:hypothetical protein